MWWTVLLCIRYSGSFKCRQFTSVKSSPWTNESICTFWQKCSKADFLWKATKLEVHPLHLPLSVILQSVSVYCISVLHFQKEVGLKLFFSCQLCWCQWQWSPTDPTKSCCPGIVPMHIQRGDSLMFWGCGDWCFTLKMGTGTTAQSGKGTLDGMWNDRKHVLELHAI